MQMKKILGILLAFCFLMSVTVAAVSAAGNVPVINNNHGNSMNKPVTTNPGNPMNNQMNKGGYNKNGYNNKGFDKFGHKKGYHTKGHWMFKKTRHNKDGHHKSYWYTNDKYWHWDY